jgi:hypothetical protein
VGADRGRADHREHCGEECRGKAQDEVVEASHQEVVAARARPNGQATYKM